MGKGASSSDKGNYPVARDYQKSESYLNKHNLESKPSVYSSIPIQKKDYKRYAYESKNPIPNLLYSLNSLIEKEQYTTSKQSVEGYLSLLKQTLPYHSSKGNPYNINISNLELKVEKEKLFSSLLCLKCGKPFCKAH